MNNLKELSFEEMVEVDGGYWASYYAQSSIGKCHLAVRDFCSSFIDGFSAGYESTPKYDPKH